MELCVCSVHVQSTWFPRLYAVLLQTVSCMSQIQTYTLFMSFRNETCTMRTSRIRYEQKQSIFNFFINQFFRRLPPKGPMSFICIKEFSGSLTCNGLQRSKQLQIKVSFKRFGAQSDLLLMGFFQGSYTFRPRNAKVHVKIYAIQLLTKWHSTLSQNDKGDRKAITIMNNVAQYIHQSTSLTEYSRQTHVMHFLSIFGNIQCSRCTQSHHNTCFDTVNNTASC